MLIDDLTWPSLAKELEETHLRMMMCNDMSDIYEIINDFRVRHYLPEIPKSDNTAYTLTPRQTL